jgi:hypothetical protein
MERIHYRSTSLLDIQAELHQQELLRDARVARPIEMRRRRRSPPFGLHVLERLGLT